MTKKEETAQKQEPRYTKEQISASKKYEKDVDIVNALLKDGELYTLSEVDVAIEKFKKGKVK